MYKQGMCAALALAEAPPAELRVASLEQERRRLAAPPAGNPFVAPANVTPLTAARPRARVAVAGSVVHVECRAWAGGPTLEVTIDDGSASLTLVFLGRRTMAGIHVGRALVAAGTVADRHGRSIVLNPQVWLRSAA